MKYSVSSSASWPTVCQNIASFLFGCLQPYCIFHFISFSSVTKHLLGVTLWHGQFIWVDNFWELYSWTCVFKFPFTPYFFFPWNGSRKCTQTKICMWFYLEGLTRDVDLCVSSLFLQQESYFELCTKLPLYMQKLRYWAITFFQLENNMFWAVPEHHIKTFLIFLSAMQILFLWKNDLGDHSSCSWGVFAPRSCPLISFWVFQAP